MQKLLRSLAAALLILTCVPGVVGHASAAAVQPKVVIVVGAVQGTTAAYRADGDAAAAAFGRYTSNIVKVYSPNATWPNVQAAAQGAAVLVYIGHGSGYPNPYLSYLQPNADNGMGLNYSDGTRPQSDSYTKYYGENYMGTLNLAPNAVVILWHLCYASGDNEWGTGAPTLATAKTRIDGYASGFLRGNARAVIADGVAGRLDSYADGIFAGHTTIDQVWKTAETFRNHVSSWDSSRNAGFVSQMDPSLDNPAPDGDPYYRSMVSYPGLKTDDVGVDNFVAPAPSTYYPVTPARLLDTRDGTGLAGPFSAGHARTFTVSGSVVPADATAVTGNLTVTGQTSKGWLYVGPDPLDNPTSSMLNFPVGDDRANNVSVQLGSATVNNARVATLSVTYGAPDGNTTHVIFDVTGYFKADQGGATYHALQPARIADSRIGLGIAGALPSSSARSFQVTGAGGVPAGAIAVTGNLTVTEQTSKGYFSVGPVQTNTPTSSTLNFPAGDNRANGVTATLAGDGKLYVTFVGAGPGTSAQVVFDVTGYYTRGLDGAFFVPLPPARILDTRYGIGLPSALGAQSARTFGVANMGHVSPAAAAVTGNLTVTQQTYPGFFFVGPTPTNTPGSSTLNFPVGDNRSNGVTVQLENGTLSVTYAASRSGQSAHVIFDVTGYFK